MDKKEILENLCDYDPRNPNYEELKECVLIDDADIMKQPRTNCFCDNCFKGRDPLAVELLKVKFPN